MNIIEGKIGAGSLFEEMTLLKEIHGQTGVKKTINSELWHACAGPLVSLPQVGSLVYYFPQGHSEQVAATTNRTETTQVPNYPNLPSQLLCQVLSSTLHADKAICATDEIYAQMSLQPLNSEKDVLPIPDIGMRPSKHPSEFFCKALTPSDTSTHGGFSVPRRAAEKLFPSLDFSMQPPTQELVVRDLHDNTWTFRHIYRGQPKRHLLTTGWSMFVGAKRLKAGDTVLFIRDGKSQLLLGVRRADRQQTALVLSADSMHIGVLAAAAHAADNRSPFTIFYNPRACPSEFVIPLVKYRKSVYGNQLSIGMRFGMMFETEESGKRRCMGTITGISDVDPLRWSNSKWHNLQVQWDEPGCDDRQNRVSPWDIETPESLFIFPPFASTLKRPFNSSFNVEGDNTVAHPFIRATEAINTNISNPLTNILTKPQTINNTGPVSPVIQKASETVPPSLGPAINPQTLVNELPVVNHSSPIEQLDPSLCGVVPAPGQETWDSHDDVYNGGGSVVDPSVSSVVLDELCEFKDGDYSDLSGFLVNNNISPGHEILDNSRGTSSSNGEFIDTGIMQNESWPQVGPPPRIRAYTKIQKAGSVGRSIDVSRFKNYNELRSEIERMFGLDGLLNNSIGSGWKLVYVDFENDVLLVGDDPWGEFVGCVQCIRILSHCEVRQMGEEGMQLLNNSNAELQVLIA